MCDTLNELFGQKRQSASTVIPTRMGALSKQTAHFGLSFEQLLNHYSMFPFYMSFSSETLYEKVLSWAMNNKNGSAATELGLFGYTARATMLRFCPQCYQYETTQYGESYWHRLHQTPGVLICEKHGCRLLDSKIYATSKQKEGYRTSKEDNLFPTILLPKFDNEIQALANQLVSDIQYLYSNPVQMRTLFAEHQWTFSRLYLSLLQEKRLTTEQGCLHRKAFLTAFVVAINVSKKEVYFKSTHAF